MLSDSSYHTAMAVYLGAGALAVLLLAWWLLRRWPGFPSLLLVLLSAALLLTPAYPKEGVTTFAPALVVAAFQYMTAGAEAAQHALRPLVAASLVALLLAVLLRFTVLRRARQSTAPGAGEDGG
ncbi:hypothetical protein [Haliea sp. E17]|uniref:hypothetical protein n=1 Tax=Haliea sp. E17 TaxID=3401576 RepID=UPI003AAD6313